MSVSTFYDIFSENLDWFNTIQNTVEKRMQIEIQNIIQYQEKQQKELREELLSVHRAPRRNAINRDLRRAQNIVVNFPKDFFLFQSMTLLLFLDAQVQDYFSQLFTHVLFKRQGIKSKKKVDRMLYNVFKGDVKKIFDFGTKIGIIHKWTPAEIRSFNYFKLVRHLYAHKTGKLDLRFASKILKYARENELPRNMFLSDQLDGKIWRINDISHREGIRDIVSRYDESFLRCYYDIAFPGRSTIL